VGLPKNFHRGSNSHAPFGAAVSLLPQKGQEVPGWITVTGTCRPLPWDVLPNPTAPVAVAVLGQGTLMNRFNISHY